MHLKMWLAALLLFPVSSRAQETGARDCFWQAQGDPVVLNVAFPDFAARYWLSTFVLPQGAELELTGQYPFARYMSFNLYDEGLAPVDGIADIAIAPDEGSTNPFESGARRDAAERSYTTHVRSTPPPDARAPNTMYLTVDGTVTLQPLTGSETASPVGVMLYRIYLPDAGRDLTGDVPLPQVALVFDDGTRVEGPDVCTILGTTVPDVLLPLLQSTTPPTLPRPTRGVTDPMTWERFANIFESFGVVAPDPVRTFLPPNGGFFSNSDNAYVVSSWDTSFGEVISLIGRAPTFPDTVSGNTVMESAQTRYWSLCQNDQLVGTRAISCASDYEIPLTPERDYIAVVSGADTRPANAAPECGVTWLPSGPNPRGTLILRNMLPAADFVQSVQAVVDYLNPATTMGPYLPVGKHLSKAEFEALGCPVTTAAMIELLKRHDIERPAMIVGTGSGTSGATGSSHGGGGSLDVWALLFPSLVALRRRVRAARVLAGVTVLCGLAACGRGGSEGSGSAPPLGELVPKEIRDVNIVSSAADTLNGTATTSVPATVFIPEHHKGQTYPLILHSHGWGGSRKNNDRTTSYPIGTPLGYFLNMDSLLPVLVDRGYAVISFDERGWGASTSEVKVMNPDYETQDAIAVLDWAEANLDLARDGSGDPLIGTMGGSYGGGFQHNLAMLDPRIDAMIPGATWSSFYTALGPNDVLKKSWTGILCATGNLATLGPEVAQSCQEGFYNVTTRFIDEESEEVIQYFKDNSWIGCEQGGFRGHPCRSAPVDVLLVQGQRDVLFNVNEAIVALDFYRTRGGDVRLLTMQGGHINPGVQQPDGPITCGEWDIFDIYLRWFDAKLKSTGTLDGIPTVCLSLDGDTGAEFEGVPRGGDVSVTIPADAALSVRAGQTVFVPADGGVITEDGLVLAGMPTIDNLRVGDGVAFIGVAIRHSGDLSDPMTPIDEQVVPFRSDRDLTMSPRLVAVAENLKIGDMPGILLMSDNAQYEPAGPTPIGLNFATNSAIVSGIFHLPVLRPRRLTTASK